MNDDGPQHIECRAAVEISPTTTNEILFLPTGLHAITPVSGGIGRPIKVKVDAESAIVIQQQHSKLKASGKRPYFDFNHEDGPASCGVFRTRTKRNRYDRPALLNAPDSSHAIAYGSSP